MPGPTDFPKASRIIQFAMEDAGLLQDGEEPSSEQYSKYMVRLNDLINLWQTQGLKLWLIRDITIPLTTAKSSYTIGSTGDVVMDKPLRVLGASYVRTNGSDSVMEARPWGGYFGASPTINTGEPSFYFTDKGQTLLTVHIWPVPTAAVVAAGSVHLLAQIQVPNLVSLTDTMAFPQEWFLALRWGLADDICTGQPQAIMDRCERRANTYRTVLEDWDVEDTSVSFAPSDAGYAHYSNFK